MQDKKYTKRVFSYKLRGTKKQLEEMYDCLNRECYWETKFKKYFEVIRTTHGLFFIPHKKYYVGDYVRLYMEKFSVSENEVIELITSIR